MTKDKDEKAVIRARMARTGESYAAARAQLAKDEPEGKPPAPSERSFIVRMTAPADSALNAARRVKGGPWELLLALRQTNGIASAVLTELGLEARSYDQWLRETRAPGGAEEDRRALLNKAQAVAATLILEQEAKLIDSGVLLRAAVSLLAAVPAQSEGLAARLKQVDLVVLCAAAEQQHGPEAMPKETDGSERTGMFERFTDKARRVIVAAQEEARGLDHHYIGTEHLLLGLLTGDGVAGQVLTSQGVSLDDMRAQVLTAVGRGATDPGRDHIPFTPRTKRVLELALVEALELQHNYIGTEHILLGLIREGEGIGVQLLRQAGVTDEVARAAVIDFLVKLTRPAEPDEQPPTAP